MNAMATILVVDDEEVVRRSHLRVLGTTLPASRRSATASRRCKAMEAAALRRRAAGPAHARHRRHVGAADDEARWPESEVIVITGYPSVDTAKEAIRLGARDYLAKPLAPGEVIERGPRRDGAQALDACACEPTAPGDPRRGRPA